MEKLIKSKKSRKLKVKVPKKRTKKSLRKECDDLIRAKCRAKGSCEICGNTQNLQWCHFVTRARIRLRYHELNYACLCAGCHFHGHQNPGWLVNEWKRLRGVDRVEWLIREANVVGPVHEDFYYNILQSKGGQK
jgi:hypothetical protein